jgi:c(7)-type cytochrome triheme protein
VNRLWVPAVLILLLGVPFFLYAKDYKVVTFKTVNAGKVNFPHDPHLKKLGNNCTQCHNALYTIGKQNPPVTMAEMEKGKSCGACHNTVKAFGLPECTRCHITKEVPIQIPDFGTITFSHTFHLTRFQCWDCHNGLFVAGPGNPHVSMADMEGGLSCGGCHDGKIAFSVKGDCVKCHLVKDIAFGADALFKHTVHLGLGYGCRDCHSQHFIAGPNSKRYTMLDMETGKSCGACHEGKTAFNVTGDCQRCHGGNREITYEAAAAYFPHVFHTKIFICADCHSGIFTGGPTSRRYTMAEMEQDRSCGACHDGKIAFGVTANCDRCHRQTKELALAVQPIGTVPFSHKVHTSLFKCDDCHNKVFATGSQARRFTMAEMEKGKSCGACHNDETAFSVKANCSRCHPVRDIPYVLDAWFGHNRHLQMYTCTDCHNAFFAAGPGNKRRTMVDMEKDQSCGACHDGFIAFSVAGDCDRCHKSTKELVIKTRGAGPTPFSHKVHISLFKCGDCHNRIFPTGVAAKRFTMADMEAGKSCGACHDAKTAFTVRENCVRCHPVKEIQMQPSGATFSHKLHTGLYRCNECHDRLFNPGAGNRRVSMAAMEKKQESCGACHNGKTAFSVTGSCLKCHPILKAISYELQSKAVGDAFFSHKVHLGRGYTCSDCHYSVIKTGDERKSFTMSEMGQGLSCGYCHGALMAFSVRDQNACNRCHKDQ